MRRNEHTVFSDKNESKQHKKGEEFHRCTFKYLGKSAEMR